MKEQSEGHIGYSCNGLYEYFVCGQNIYKAHRTCVLDVNTGYRLGANYVCRSATGSSTIHPLAVSADPGEGSAN